MRSPWAIAAAAVSALFVALLIAAEWRDDRRGVAITKPIASLAFVTCGALTLPLATAHGRLLLSGLVLSAVGDVLLIPKRSAAFLAGLSAFLFAHVAYGAAFVSRDASIVAAVGAALPLAIACAVVLVWLLPKVPKKLRAPVVAYALAISAMVALAVGMVAAGGPAPLLGAAIAFYASDLAVARDRFVSPGFSNRAWGLPLYYGAQIVFALAR